ncbi:hypothetical protein DBV05_g8628 [Lasiodiplodia theobromae]|uniref:PD-(D/E)XK nuclease-like domain-containing protein n=1 Tax=Lasiodiplodia theobromae TaxID=45133 RepID=A0A5N5D4N7_9PEZI|nr:hypothetical protein DBV05_g8628 [Lasiodiplodia theobromae]
MRERSSSSFESESLASTPRLPVSVAGVKRRRRTGAARTSTTLAARPRHADDDEDDKHDDDDDDDDDDEDDDNDYDDEEPEEPRLQRRRHVDTPSSTSSPPNNGYRKQQRLNRTLALPGDVMVVRDFEMDRPPFPLAVMVQGIYTIKTGRHVFFYEEQEKGPRAPETNRDFEFLEDVQHPYYAPVLTRDALQKIVEVARECSNGKHCVADWNARVHSAVLDLAPHNTTFTERICFMNCNTAQIQPESLVPSWPRLTEYQLTSKMVDFAVCLRFDRDDDLECMRDVILKSNPQSLSINQTLHDPLIATPIALSIFTKRPDQTWDEAQLQISVWVAAQLKRLEQLVKSAWGEEWRKHAYDFLPFIIIDGHEWSFLAASLNGIGQTVIWRKIMFSDTMTESGVQQIVATLHWIAIWAQRTYRRWLYESVLDVSMPPDDGDY